MENGKAGTKEKRRPDGLTVARAYRSTRVAMHEAVDKLTNEPNLHL